MGSSIREGVISPGAAFCVAFFYPAEALTPDVVPESRLLPKAHDIYPAISRKLTQSGFPRFYKIMSSTLSAYLLWTGILSLVFTGLAALDWGCTLDRR